MRRAEVLVALALAVAAALFLHQTLQLRTGWTEIGPGAGFFPFWLAVGVLACSVALFVQGLTGVARARGRDDPFIPLGAWKSLLIVFVPIILLIAALRFLGLYIGGGLYLAANMVFLGRFRWPLVLVLSVGIPILLFMFFERWMRLPLPKGILLEYLLYGR